VRYIGERAAPPVNSQLRKEFLRWRECQTAHYGLRKVLRCAVSKATLVCYDCHMAQTLAAHGLEEHLQVSLIFALIVSFMYWLLKHPYLIKYFKLV
jgi:hypothetical protein